MNKELKSCPFCGGEEIDISRVYINPISPDSLPDEVYVGCISCGIGYTEELELDAIKAWNRRFKDSRDAYALLEKHLEDVRDALKKGQEIDHRGIDIVLSVAAGILKRE